MLFKDKESGREYDLTNVAGSDFWSNNHEKLFIVDIQTGYCLETTGLRALEAVLRRENKQNGYCSVCQGQCLKSEARSMVDNLWDGWIK